MSKIFQQLEVDKQEKFIILKALNVWRTLTVNEDNRDYKNGEIDVDAINELIKKIKLLNFK